MIEAILIDDEYNAIKNLKWEIERFCPDIIIKDTFTDPVEAISAINYLKPDCVFLDIEMPEMDGFQLLQNLKYRDFDLIITTAYDNYAIKAFKQHAVDYLLKPIDSDDLISAVERIKKKKNQNSLGFEIKKVIASLTKEQDKKIGLPMSGKIVYVEAENIIYCKSDGNYTEIYLEEGRTEVVTKQLKEMEQILRTDFFYRVHNSYIINLKHIKEYIKGEGQYLILTNGANIPISRKKKDELSILLNT